MIKCQNCKKKVDKPAYYKGKIVCQKCWRELKQIITKEDIQSFVLGL